jgi:uncharacterized protein YdhG (YjbR/CyaY superfamily)
MSPQKDRQKSVKSTVATGKTVRGFSDEEKAAARARVQEVKAEARASKSREEGESQVVGAIASMQEPDRSMAKRLHAIIKANAPVLFPKTWYGMPAYATEEGKIVCFFQTAQKFKMRYATLGFNDSAKLDEDAMWPVAFALKKLTTAEEAKIIALVKKAVS